MELVRHVAKQAQISCFIESMNDNYNSFVGERGIRLSGGQRQRIGIARALYKQSEVLVLDEATSALDSYTEDEVMKSLDGISGAITVIMIAHRTSTLKNCDRIVKIENGVVAEEFNPTGFF